MSDQTLPDITKHADTLYALFPLAEAMVQRFSLGRLRRRTDGGTPTGR